MREKKFQKNELYEMKYGFQERNSNFRFLLILLALFVVIFTFRVYWTNAFNGVIVNGDSMSKTLSNHDALLMRLVKKEGQAKRGDIIVVYVGDYEECGSVQDGFLIKRLIATEGDKLYCFDGQIFICYKGSEEYVPLYEPYAYYGINDSYKMEYDFATYEVGEGEIFFLGDNRSREGSSIDSRYQEKPYGSHLESSLYKEKDIYGIVPDWAVRNKDWIEKIFF